MDNKAAKALLLKYEEGKCTEQEQALLESWFIKIKSEQEAHGLSEQELKYDLEKVGRSLGLHSYRIGNWAAAAAVFLILSAGIWFYNAQQSFVGDNQQIAQNDIAPGRNTATLSLGNGEMITLSDAKTGVVIDGSSLKYNDGSKVRFSSGSQSLDPRKGGQSITGSVGDPSIYRKEEQLTARTPRGGTYQVVLPDGTKVWLNAASSLKFPSTFLGLKERKVELNGEAYFEVATSYVSLSGLPLSNSSSSSGSESSLRGRRTKQSFIVVTKDQEVKVLGTHFNINSYADESSVKTTLLEGSVKVSSLREAPGNGVEKQGIILKPNQQSVNNGTAIKVNEVDPEEAVAWKNSLFKFNNEHLESIMRKVARWYNVEVVYENELLKQTEYGGTVSRFDKISSVLKKLEYTGQVHFKVAGRRVTVTK